MQAQLLAATPASSADDDQLRRPDRHQSRGAGCSPAPAPRRGAARWPPREPAGAPPRARAAKRRPAAGPRRGGTAGACRSCARRRIDRLPAMGAVDAPDRPRAAIDQTLAPATRAGSRSSVVVVVTSAWGSAADAPHEVRPSIGIELAEHVVEQQQRRPAVERREEVQLRELEREDGACAAGRATRRRRGRDRRSRGRRRRDAGPRASRRSRAPSRPSRASRRRSGRGVVLSLAGRRHW